VDVGPTHSTSQRDAPAIHQQVVFRAIFPSISGTGTGI
jgi:hypothetical protein